MKELAGRAQASGNPSLLLNEHVRSLRWTGGDDRNQNYNGGGGNNDNNNGSKNDKDRNKRTRKRAEQRRNNKNNQNRQETRDYYNPEKQGPYQGQQQ